MDGKATGYQHLITRIQLSEAAHTGFQLRPVHNSLSGYLRGWYWVYKRENGRTMEAGPYGDIEKASKAAIRWAKKTVETGSSRLGLGEELINELKWATIMLAGALAHADIEVSKKDMFKL